MSTLKLDVAVNDWINNETTTLDVVNLFTFDTTSPMEATAGALFLGTDTTDLSVTGREIYADPKNLATAVASIMNHNQKKVGFFPGQLTPEQIFVKFGDYGKALQTTPFFHLDKHESHKQIMYTKDYNKLIEQISSLYDGMTSSEQEKIKNSIQDIAKSVFDQSKSERWENLFSQTAIDLTNPANPKISLYYTTLHMKHEKKGNKTEVSEQEYSVQTIQFSVLCQLIQANADKLVKIDETHIDPWIDASSSKHNKAVKLCFMKD